MMLPHLRGYGIVSILCDYKHIVWAYMCRICIWTCVGSTMIFFFFSCIATCESFLSILVVSITFNIVSDNFVIHSILGDRNRQIILSVVIILFYFIFFFFFFEITSF